MKQDLAKAEAITAEMERRCYNGHVLYQKGANDGRGKDLSHTCAACGLADGELDQPCRPLKTYLLTLANDARGSWKTRFKAVKLPLWKLWLIRAIGWKCEEIKS